MSRRRRSLAFSGPANGHPRYGSRGTRTASKLGRAISIKRLEQLLSTDVIRPRKPHGTA